MVRVAKVILKNLPDRNPVRVSYSSWTLKDGHLCLYDEAGNPVATFELGNVIYWVQGRDIDQTTQG